MKEHNLFGKIKLKKKKKKETNCFDCLHKKVCNQDMHKRCVNHEFGTSEYGIETCGSCSNHYTRWDTKPIPCFVCNDFLPIVSNAENFITSVNNKNLKD